MTTPSIPAPAPEFGPNPIPQRRFTFTAPNAEACLLHPFKYQVAVRDGAVTTGYVQFVHTHSISALVRKYPAFTFSRSVLCYTEALAWLKSLDLGHFLAFSDYAHPLRLKRPASPLPTPSPRPCRLRAPMRLPSPPIPAPAPVDIYSFPDSAPCLVTSESSSTPAPVPLPSPTTPASLLHSLLTLLVNYRPKS